MTASPSEARITLEEPLAGETLLRHVRALADDIGPRPAGDLPEQQARDYIRATLAEMGLEDIEAMAFLAPDTWGYSIIAPALLALFSNLLPRRFWITRLLGAIGSAVAALELWRGFTVREQWLSFFYPAGHSGNLIARLPAAGEARRKIVLIGHTDSNKHRTSFAPMMKQALQASGTGGLLTAIGNAAAQAALVFGKNQRAEQQRRQTMRQIAGFLPLLLWDERGDFVDGANDNATAVACLLGLGAQLMQTPLAHTEVWLAFTGAEESGCIGIDKLLDRHGEALRDAWFIDFEMVGAGDIAYVSRHSSFTSLTPYRPDPQTTVIANKVAQANPDLSIGGRDMMISEEVRTLRQRGFRGICLAGVGEDGWLVNWHQESDRSEHIQAETLAKAARYAWAIMQEIDAGA